MSLCFNTSSQRVCVTVTPLTLSGFFQSIGVAPSVGTSIENAAAPLIRTNLRNAIYTSDYSFLNPAIPQNLSPYASQIASFLVGDYILSRLNNMPLVTQAGITPGSVVTGGINGIINSGVSYALNQVGITGAEAIAYASTITPAITSAISSLLGTNGLSVTGVSGAIANALAPPITSAINSLSPIPIPQSAVSGAIGAATNYVLTKVFDAVQQ